MRSMVDRVFTDFVESSINNLRACQADGKQPHALASTGNPQMAITTNESQAETWTRVGSGEGFVTVTCPSYVHWIITESDSAPDEALIGHRMEGRTEHWSLAANERLWVRTGGPFTVTPDNPPA